MTSYRGGARPEVRRVVPLAERAQDPTSLAAMLALPRRTKKPAFTLDIGDTNVWLRALNGDLLGDLELGSLAFDAVSYRAPDLTWATPGWLVRHRGGVLHVGTDVPELLFPNAPLAPLACIYPLSSSDFRAVRAALAAVAG